MPGMGESRSVRPHPVVWIGWLAAGLSWIVAQFLPWATSGALSRSSLLDAARFVSEGTLDDWIPTGAAVAALLPVVTGVLLVGLAGIGGRLAWAARAVFALVGAVVVVVLVVELGDLPGAGDGVGPGAVLGLVGAAVAVLTLVADAVLRLVGNSAVPPRKVPPSH